MKIAVCLSGQPRTVGTAHKSILAYFSNHDVDYFCHLWDYNTWKIIGSLSHSEQQKVPQEDIDLIRSEFKPIDYRMDGANHEFVHSYQSLFRSMAYANQLKIKHELSSGKTYDLVVKARYDIAFPPDLRFTPQTNPYPRTLCVHYPCRLPYEYNRLSISDVLFYGDSWAMDIATDAYTHVLSERRPTLADREGGLGPGTILADHIVRSNILYTSVDTLEVIVRPEVRHLEVADNWNEIHRVHWSYY